MSVVFTANDAFWDKQLDLALHDPDSSQHEALRRLIERKREIRDITLRQYTMCTTVLEHIFRLAPDQCWKRDGIGCCGWEGSVDDDLNAAIKDWKELRRARLAERMPTGSEWHGACTYHKEDEGCVLSELKSPKCFYTVCDSDLPESLVL